jgi:hypothetical protein
VQKRGHSGDDLGDAPKRANVKDEAVPATRPPQYRMTQNLTPQGTPVYRQLKVEDALAYLDQVRGCAARARVEGGRGGGGKGGGQVAPCLHGKPGALQQPRRRPAARLCLWRAECLWRCAV